MTSTSLSVFFAGIKNNYYKKHLATDNHKNATNGGQF